MVSSPLQKISNSQKRRTRRLRMRRGSLNSQTSQISPTVTLSPTTPTPPPPLPRMISTSKTFPPLTSKTSTSPTLTSQTSTSTSPSPTLKPVNPTNPTNPQSPSTSQRLSTTQTKTSPLRRSHSSTSVDIVDDPQDGSITPDTLSNYDLDIDMLASRAFSRDGAPAYPTTPPGLGLGLVSPSTPKIIIDDYLEDVSLSSETTSQSSTSSQSQGLSRARRLTATIGSGSSSIDDHYELVVMPQLEIILDAVRAVQYEVNHLHNELLDLKVTTRHSLKKIWEYLNFSV